MVWAAVSGVMLGQAPAKAEVPAVSAGGKRPMTFVDLMAMKRVSDPQVSPSGRWVMFSVTEVSLEKNTKISNLWVAPMAGGGGRTEAGPPAARKADKQIGEGGGGERQLTFGEVSQTNGRFSLDGKWVLLLSAGGGTSQIWTAKWNDADGTMAKPQPLTSVATEADGAVWSPDSKRILFVSSVYPKCSDKAVWSEEDACNKARMDAEAKNLVEAQVWDHLLYRHWNAFTGERRSHVLVVDFPDGERVRDLTPRSAVGDAETPTFSLGGPVGYAWAPDSREIAYVTNLGKVPAASTNNDVFTLRLDEAGAKAVKMSTSPGSDDGPQYSPDGKWLAFRSQARAGYESDRFRLMVMDRSETARQPGSETERQRDGGSVLRELMPKFDRWVDEFVWAPDSKAIYFASGDRGSENIFSFSLPDQTLSLRTQGVRGFENSPDSQIFRSENDLGEYSDLHVSGDGKTLIADMVNARAPANVVSLAIDDTEEMNDTGQHVARRPSDGTPATIRLVLFREERLTRLNDAVLNKLDLRRMESFDFAGAEGAKVQGFVVRPPNFDSAKKYPVKFLIHGGPQGAWGDAWSYRWNPELFAADGYVVVMVNPRGSTGYGQAFIDGVNGDWGGKAYVDLMKGLDAAEAKFPFIDKDRECALGASYGGFMANWILTHPDPRRPDRFKCIVTHDGMYNPAAAYGTTEEMWFNEWEFRRPGAAEPGQPWRYAAGLVADDPFRKWSPMLHIQDAKTPTLVIHSQKDYRLDVSEGFQLFTALQRLGVPSKMLYFPDEGHWVLKPRNSELWYRTVNDWCDRWTGSGTYAGGAGRAEAQR